MRITRLTALKFVRPLLVIVALAAVTFAAPAARADWFKKITRSAKQAVQQTTEVTNTVVQQTTTVANTAVTETSNFGQSAGQAISQGSQDVGREIEKQARPAAELAVEQLKNNIVGQHGDLMRDTATNWKSLVEGNGEDVQAIVQAMKDRNGDEAGKRIVNLLTNNGGLRKLIENAKDKRFGSIVFLTSASAAAGVGASGSVGEAISIDALVHYFQHGSFPAGQVTASYFAAGGLTVGASGGGSADVAIGFTFSQPDGVGGPSLDLNAELNLVVGGNTALSFDPTGGINFIGFAIGASGGAKFDLSGGVSYTQLLLKINDPLNAPFGQ